MERRIPPDEAPRVVDSPVRGAIAILDTLFSDSPQPRVRTQAAKSCGELLGRHVLNLLGACGELNLTGLQSVAVTLFRPLEDALDCLAAVTMIAGAAERWRRGELKPSDAAKLWVERSSVKPITDESFSDYRRRLRSTFNPFSHCDPIVPDWDVFVEQHPLKAGMFRLRINHENQVIVSNAYRIDAFLVAHLWEVLAVIEEAYNSYIEIREEISDQLNIVKSEMRKLLAEQHKQGLRDTVYPPELELLSGDEVQKLEMPSIHENWQGCWSCSSVDGQLYGKLRLKQHHSWLTGTLTIEVASGAITCGVTEQLSGAMEGSRLLLDGVSAEISPSTDRFRYALDTFELNLSEDRDLLTGTHSCDLGTGEASFKADR